MNDDLIQYRDQRQGSFYSIGRERIDIGDFSDDAVLTIHIVQDPIVDHFERSVFTILEMVGQLGGLYEILVVLTSLLIQRIVYKLYSLSILKNLYYIERKSDTNNDDYVKKGNINSYQKKLDIDQSDIKDEIKIESAEDNNSSIIEDNEARKRYDKYKWYRTKTDSTQIQDDFKKLQKEDLIRNKISNKLSSIVKFAPNSKDYLYIISKVIRF